MAQVFNRISMLSRLAAAVFNNYKQQSSQLFQDSENSSYITNISAHRQAVEHIREVQAEYQLRGWVR